MTLAAGAGVLFLSGLGIWQMQRLQWKTDLIARVEARLAAPAVAAPGPAAWSGITATADEYRRVAVTGRYELADEVLVKAVTAEGAGFWVMAPLTTAEGWRVWINRGFVPAARRAAGDRSRPEAAQQQVTGLLRISQPDGAFLRRNDPQGGQWYSRDIAALSQHYGLRDAAPYFIDADAAQPDMLPIGGLTVVRFHNSHLTYALTWFAMAIGLGAGAWHVLRRDRSGD